MTKASAARKTVRSSGKYLRTLHFSGHSRLAKNNLRLRRGALANDEIKFGARGWVQPEPNLNGSSVAVDNRASCSLLKRTEWCGGWVLGVGSVLIQHHDPANRMQRSAAAQVLPSLARSNQRVDQPGTGDGG